LGVGWGWVILAVVEVPTAAASEDQQRRIAGGLQRLGLGAGDRAVLATTSRGAMLSAILGSLRVGIVPVLLNTGLLDHERAALVADARPGAVIDDAGLDRLLDAAPVDLAPHPLARPMHYTSGTTGVPKGVWSGLLTGAEARALVAEEAELWEFGADDVHLVNSPFHHSVSIRFGGGTLLAGGTVLVAPRFDAATAARAIATHRPTTTFLVPAHLQRLFALPGLPDPSSLRLVVHAGAPCPVPLKHRAIAHFGADRIWEFDDGGYLYLDGRRDDLIITGGVNVYPLEIEQALAGLAGIEQVAVFGVEDERWGQRVCAAVVGTVDAGAVHRWAAERLAGYKRPKDVFVVDELPHTSTGKLQRRRLPAQLGLNWA
jgi:acyl-CoA synthetase (AMP-forming)/AMP-acid ligase II